MSPKRILQGLMAILLCRLLVANVHTLAPHQPDDWIFLRLTQSEFMFLQFGDIAVYYGGVISQRWPIFGGEVA